MDLTAHALEKDEDLARIRAYVRRARHGGQVRLPPESRLAEELGVTRSRLRGLLKRLESEGLIWRHVGKGTFIGERSLTTDLGSLPELLNPLEAFEARIVIEPQLAALAALRASPREVEEMQALQARMAGITAFDEWAEWDERLHRLVAKAARNTLLLVLYDAIRQSAPSGMTNRLHSVFSGHPRAETNVEHDLYIQAIADRDSQKAEALMRAHLVSVRRALFGD
jgi:GntR family transcriptional regulator, transcriptional repressor for pyruvate dehydrogenase complex